MTVSAVGGDAGGCPQGCFLGVLVYIIQLCGGEPQG